MSSCLYYSLVIVTKYCFITIYYSVLSAQDTKLHVATTVFSFRVLYTYESYIT